MSFSGFHQEAFDFFAELAKNNERAWFEENEERFENHIMVPLRELTEELGVFMKDLNPDFQMLDPMDRHFSNMKRGAESPPGTPEYKTNVYTFFWNTSIGRLADAHFHVSVNAEGVGLGFSIYDFAKNRRARISQIFKPRLETDLALMDDYIKAAYLRRGFQFHRYARAPGRIGLREVEAFPPKASEWMNTLGWVVSRHIHTASSRLTPGSFLTEVQETFARLYPLYTFASDPRNDWKRNVQKAFPK